MPFAKTIGPLKENRNKSEVSKVFSSFMFDIFHSWHGFTEKGSCQNIANFGN